MSDLTDAPDLTWPEDPETARALRRRRRGRIAALLTSLVVVLAVVGTGLGVTLRFQDRALPGSSVAGRSVTGMTAEEIAALVGADAERVEVTVTARGQETTVPLAQTGVTVDAQATAARAVASSPGPVDMIGSFFQETTHEPVIRVDEAAVAAFAESLVPAGEQSPVDARLVQDESDEDAGGPAAWSVVEGAAGHAVDAEALGADIAAAAADMAPFDVAAPVATVEPGITTAEAQEAHDTLQAAFEAPVELVAPETTHEADADDREDWYTVAADAAAGTISIGSDPEAVSAYLADVVDDVNEEAEDGIEQVDPAGEVVSTVAEPEDGLRVTDADRVAEELLAAVAAGEAYTGEFATETVAASMTQVDAPESKTEETEETEETETSEEGAPKPEEAATATGEKWIDINLSSRTVTAYQGDTVVFGPVSVVTGDSTEGNPSDPGSFEVYLKYEEQDMTNASRYSPDDPDYYYNEDVPWVMYYNGGEGFHGAPWRSSFGYEGSHGCINMTVSDAKWLWEWAPMGTRVEAHH